MVRNGSPSPADNFPLGHSATSPQPQPSKRDKRRNMLAEKLADMMASFSDNRDSHYRAQLAAIQADINLIMKADPYQNQPLRTAEKRPRSSSRRLWETTCLRRLVPARITLRSVEDTIRALWMLSMMRWKSVTTTSPCSRCVHAFPPVFGWDANYLSHPSTRTKPATTSASTFTTTSFTSPKKSTN